MSSLSMLEFEVQEEHLVDYESYGDYLNGLYSAAKMTAEVLIERIKRAKPDIKNFLDREEEANELLSKARAVHEDILNSYSIGIGYNDPLEKLDERKKELEGYVDRLSEIDRHLDSLVSVVDKTEAYDERGSKLTEMFNIMTEILRS